MSLMSYIWEAVSTYMKSISAVRQTPFIFYHKNLLNEVLNVLVYLILLFCHFFNDAVYFWCMVVHQHYGLHKYEGYIDVIF